MAKDQNLFHADTDDAARDTLPGDALSTDHVVHVLNHLLEGARDDAHVFRAGADEVRARRHKDVLAARAAQCQAAASQLVELVITCGGQPAGGGTALGAVHRGWAHVKAAVGVAASESSVLDACERADDAAVARYREALALAPTHGYPADPADAGPRCATRPRAGASAAQYPARLSAVAAVACFLPSHAEKSVAGCAFGRAPSQAHRPCGQAQGDRRHGL
ncbi:PA2169 family four-helix-bundle protein [Variovorax sp. YR752]|uniref:PA2169 family four-helix-bundle protein n=1 Tax=Variovorax sp. YR752 TaxID=1884383 RepID=UPI003138406B